MAAREAEGGEDSPAVGIIDSQRVKTTESGGPRGLDAGKKIKGRKRHILTDTAGLLLTAQVHAANIQDRDGAPGVLASIRHAFPWLRHVFAALAAEGAETGSDDRRDPAAGAAPQACKGLRAVADAPGAASTRSSTRSATARAGP